MTEPLAQTGAVTPLLLTPEQAARALAIGRTKLYSLLAEGVLASVMVGGSRRVPVQALETYVAGLLQERRTG
jgi:excisionase family DNA binding protein